MAVEAPTDIRIVLFSERQLFRAALRLLIENHDGLTTVGERGGVEKALGTVAREQPDIILLDMDQDADKSLALLAKIRSTSNSARVIVLSDKLDPEVYRGVIRAGAKGFVLNESEPECLFKAINKVHAGEAWIDRSVMADVIDEISNHAQNKTGATRANPIGLLTERELGVVRLVCEGLRNKQIAEQLIISESTVRHHLTSIFNKLDLTDRFQLVLFAFRHGIVPPSGGR